MNKVSVIDYDAGNTMSVIKALDYLGMTVELTRDPKRLLGSDHIVFPGVGAYFDCMQKIKEYHLYDTLFEIASRKIPLLGICLGMQLLFESSEETIGCTDPKAEQINGLGILKGHIYKFNDDYSLKIPHMGWNSLTLSNKSDSMLFKGISDETYTYFVHSYYLKADNQNEVAATCNYGITFDAAIESGSIMGCQFHPEKSGEDGLKILKNFCNF